MLEAFLFIKIKNNIKIPAIVLLHVFLKRSYLSERERRCEQEYELGVRAGREGQTTPCLAESPTETGLVPRTPRSWTWAKGTCLTDWATHSYCILISSRWFWWWWSKYPLWETSGWRNPLPVELVPGSPVPKPTYPTTHHLAMLPFFHNSPAVLFHFSWSFTIVVWD